MAKHKMCSRYTNDSDQSCDTSSDSVSSHSSKEIKRRRKRKRSHDDEEKLLKKKKMKSSGKNEDYYKHKNKRSSNVAKKKKHTVEKKRSKKKKHHSETKELGNVSAHSSVFGPHPPITINKTPPVVSLTPVTAHIDKPVEVKRSLTPMTKEQYDKQQSVLRRMVDPDTGRTRLIKGDGEIMEEIVSKERHKAINKLATHNDGNAFQAGLRKLN